MLCSNNARQTKEASFILKLKIERSGAERKYNFDCQLLFNETGSRSTILLYTPTLHCINIYLQYFFPNIFIKIDKVGLRRLEKDKKNHPSSLPTSFAYPHNKWNRPCSIITIQYSLLRLICYFFSNKILSFETVS